MTSEFKGKDKNKFSVWLVDHNGMLYPDYSGLTKDEATESVDDRATSDECKVLRSNPYWTHVRAYDPNGKMIYEKEIQHVTLPIN